MRISWTNLVFFFKVQRTNYFLIKSVKELCDIVKVLNQLGFSEDVQELI
jgi:hypothetical protein